MPAKMVIVRMVWTLCETDPLSFKPYKPTLSPLNVYVDIQIPNLPKYVVMNDDDIILTPRGMAYTMKQLATAISAESTKDDEEV